MIKLIYGPGKKLVVITHGIEIWGKLNLPARNLLNKTDSILAVSHFTRNKIIEQHGIKEEKIHIFPNTIDPHFAFPHNFNKPAFLKERYGLSPGKKVIFTLTRLSSSEKYKGYDKVIEIMPQLKNSYPDIRYLIAGKYDKKEKERISSLITRLQLQDTVQLLGFIPDDEITAHYLLADVFIMPSKKEGFGIVFIEAMACGLPVIAGNRDGSVDALKNGDLGKLVNPDSKEEITAELVNALSATSLTDHEQRQQLQQKVTEAFGFPQYCKNLEMVLARV